MAPEIDDLSDINQQNQKKDLATSPDVLGKKPQIEQFLRSLKKPDPEKNEVFKALQKVGPEALVELMTPVEEVLEAREYKPVQQYKKTGEKTGPKNLDELSRNYHLPPVVHFVSIGEEPRAFFRVYVGENQSTVRPIAVVDKGGKLTNDFRKYEGGFARTPAPDQYEETNVLAYPDEEIAQDGSSTIPTSIGAQVVDYKSGYFKLPDGKSTTGLVILRDTEAWVLDPGKLRELGIDEKLLPPETKPEDAKDQTSAAETIGVSESDEAKRYESLCQAYRDQSPLKDLLATGKDQISIEEVGEALKSTSVKVDQKMDPETYERAQKSDRMGKEGFYDTSLLSVFDDLMVHYAVYMDRADPHDDIYKKLSEDVRGYFSGNEGLERSEDEKDSLQRELNALALGFFEPLLHASDYVVQQRLLGTYKLLTQVPDTYVNFTDSRIKYAVAEMAERRLSTLNTVLALCPGGRITGLKKSGQTSEVFLVESPEVAYAVKIFDYNGKRLKRHGRDGQTLAQAESSAYTMEELYPYLLDLHPDTIPDPEKPEMIVMKQLRFHDADSTPDNLDPRFENVVKSVEIAYSKPEYSGRMITQIIEFYQTALNEGVSPGSDYKIDSFYLTYPLGPEAQLKVIDMGDLYPTKNETRVLGDLCDALRISDLTRGAVAHKLGRKTDDLEPLRLAFYIPEVMLQRKDKDQIQRENYKTVRNLLTELQYDHPDVYNFLAKLFVTAGFSRYAYDAAILDIHVQKPLDKADVEPGFFREFLGGDQPDKFESIEELSSEFKRVFGETPLSDGAQVESDEGVRVQEDQASKDAEQKSQDIEEWLGLFDSGLQLTQSSIDNSESYFSGMLSDLACYRDIRRGIDTDEDGWQLSDKQQEKLDGLERQLLAQMYIEVEAQEATDQEMQKNLFMKDCEEIATLFETLIDIGEEDSDFIEDAMRTSFVQHHRSIFEHYNGLSSENKKKAEEVYKYFRDQFLDVTGLDHWKEELDERK